MTNDTNRRRQHSPSKTKTERQKQVTDGGTVSEVDVATDDADPPTSDDSQPPTMGEKIRKGDVEKARSYVLKASLGVLILLGVIATFQMYLSVMAAISQLVSSSYQPLFRAAFNLVVLLGAGLGIVLILGYLSGQASNEE